MSNIIIVNPRELEAEAEAYIGSVKTVKTVASQFDHQKTNISSFISFMKCLDEFENLITEFCELSEKDGNNLLLMKNEWLKLDSVFSGDGLYKA